jgi:hypothetical protein
MIGKACAADDKRSGRAYCHGSIDQGRPPCTALMLRTIITMTIITIMIIRMPKDRMT